MWLATNYPLTFGITLALVVAFMIWLIVKFVRFLKSIFARFQ
jgi:hypothetical protein